MPNFWKIHSVIILGFALAIAGLFYTTLSDLVRIYTVSPTFNHGYVIVPISLFLAWLNRDTLLKMTPKPFWLMLIPFLLSLIIRTIGIIGEFAMIDHAGFVLAFITGLSALLGYRLSRLLVFPLGFLIFLVPFGTELVPYLQNFTSDFIVVILNLVGIPVLQDGIFLDTPSGKFEVAEACAGLRFLIANIVVTSLFAFLSFKTWYKKAIFIALGIIVPVLANGIRATAIVMIATYTNNEYAVGFDHIVYGWGFFVVVMGILLFIGQKMADDNAYPVPFTIVPNDQSAYEIKYVLLMLAVLILLSAAFFWIG